MENIDKARQDELSKMEEQREQEQEQEKIIESLNNKWKNWKDEYKIKLCEEGK